MYFNIFVKLRSQFKTKLQMHTFPSMYFIPLVWRWPFEVKTHCNITDITYIVSVVFYFLYYHLPVLTMQEVCYLDSQSSSDQHNANIKTEFYVVYTVHCDIITYLLTYSMVQSPSWETSWFAASQEIPRILWNPKVHYRIHKLPPPVPILG
jgi:hypothetical protein